MRIFCSAILMSIVSVSAAHAQVNHNHALVLDGVDDFVTVPDTIPLRLASNDFSFCAWVYLDQYNPSEINSAIVFKRTGTPVEGYVIAIGSELNTRAPRQFYYQVVGSSGPFVGSTQEVPLGKWTHLAFVHEADLQRATIYFNGDFDSVNPNMLIPGIDNPTDLYIGRDSLTDRYFFDGMIDEVQFWSRALTPPEIRAYMRKKLSGKEKDLIGYWSFKHGDVDDESPHHHDGIAGPTTATVSENVPVIGIAPAVSILTSNCFPTSVFELQYTTNINSGQWHPVTREYRNLDDGCRIYSDPIIDPKRSYRLEVIDEE